MTGLPFTGEQAIENGLADEVGVFDDAIETAAQLAGLGSDYNVITLTQSSDGLADGFAFTESDSDSATSAAAAKLIELLKNEGFFRELYQRTDVPTARAVVTAGMPYGNKLHFGHVAGVVRAGRLPARFLRDRIGEQNVLSSAGTDCFGSPINEGYRKAWWKPASSRAPSWNTWSATTMSRRPRSTPTTSRLNIYEGSNIGHSGEVHQGISEAFIKKLHENGWRLMRRCSSTTRRRARSSTVARCRATAPCRAASPSTPMPTSATLATASRLKTLSRRSHRSRASRLRCARWRTGTSICRRSRQFLKKHVEALEADPEVRPIVPQTIKDSCARRWSI